MVPQPDRSDALRGPQGSLRDAQPPARPRLDPAQLSKLHQKSDLPAALHIAFVVGGIVATFAAYHSYSAHWPLVSWILACIVVGGFQHHLSIVQHEANHFTLFSSRRVNEWFGSLAAYSIGFTMAYRDQHLQHHRTLGQAVDPDLPNYEPYPISRIGLLKDFLWHICGGAAVTQFARQSVKRESTDAAPKSDRGMIGIAGMQLALFGLFVMAHHPADYFLLWILPLVTVTKTLAHFRNVVEHTIFADKGDAELSRYRTIETGPLEGFFFAPMNFNFHAEHHFYPGVPYYRLPELHRLLRAQPEYAKAVDVDHGYLKFLFAKALRT